MMVNQTSFWTGEGEEEEEEAQPQSFISNTQEKILNEILLFLKSDKFGNLNVQRVRESLSSLQGDGEILIKEFWRLRIISLPFRPSKAIKNLFKVFTEMFNLNICPILRLKLNLICDI